MAPKRSPSPAKARGAASPRETRPPSPRGARAKSPKGGSQEGTARKGGGPANWPVCEYCNQKFAPASLPIHQKSCRMKPELIEEQKGIEELMKLEGPRPINPNADWERCPNCGERYGEFALPPHMKRCKRLLPWGKVTDGKQYGTGPPPKKEPSFLDFLPQVLPKAFDDLGSGLSKEELERLRGLFDEHDADKNEALDQAEMTALLKQCVPQRVKDVDSLLTEFQLADEDGSGCVSFAELARYYAVLKDMGAEALPAEMIEWLRMLFERFDGDCDGQLQMGELATLLCQCFPSRAKDAKKLSSEIRGADVNGDGTISFHEFLRFYEMMLASGAEFDELAKMFHVHDANGDGVLDEHEFLQLLHQVFPEQCDENEAHVKAEFAAADRDRSKGISFAELKEYYATLETLYERLKQERDAEEAVKEAEAAAAVHAAAAAAAAAAAVAAAKAAAALKAARDKEAADRAAEEVAAAKAAARKAADEVRANEKAQAEAEAMRRKDEAERIAASLEACACGDKFLPHLLAQHQRSCEACMPKEAADPTNGGLFVPCEWCHRTFFPDRLPVHQRSCKKKPVGKGIRPTITSQQAFTDGGTVGEYSRDEAKRRRAFQLGAAIAAGAFRP